MDPSSRGPSPVGGGRGMHYAATSPLPPSQPISRSLYTPPSTPDGERRSSSTSLQRPGSADAQNRRPNHFLSGDAKSQWLEWSHERRTSFQKRMDSIERRNKEMERNRVSTPVRKARKESVMFVSPELEDQHILDDDMADDGTSTKYAYIMTTKSVTRRRAAQPDIRLTMTDLDKLSIAQWNKLAAFWEHDTFVRLRYAGIILCFIAFVFGMVAIPLDTWITFRDYPEPGEFYAGLWYLCSMPVDGVTNCTSEFHTDWDNGVVGLMLFSVGAGFFAIVLSIFGACAVGLPQKIYYFHSAGEIFFICAVTACTALIVYPVTTSQKEGLKDYTLHIGYALGWASAVFFFLSAACLCMDDLYLSIAKNSCFRALKGDRITNVRV